MAQSGNQAAGRCSGLRGYYAQKVQAGPKIASARSVCFAVRATGLQATPVLSPRYHISRGVGQTYHDSLVVHGRELTLFEVLMGRLAAKGHKLRAFAFVRNELPHVAKRVATLVQSITGKTRPRLSFITDGAAATRATRATSGCAGYGSRHDLLGPPRQRGNETNPR